MVIADRYELVERLGRGGMGEVWQARDLSLNVDVAVKSIRMHPQDTTEPHRSALVYARKEAQHAAALRDHPNIVAVHDVVEHEGLPWTVMRLVRGQSVAELLEDEPDGLSVELIDRIARGVLAALAAAHGVGITHRDIKPPNVMITDGGDVLVTDFGIARHHADTKITMTGAVVGTAAYVAPERLKGVESPAGDLWSLGVTLHQMVTGVSPFDRGSVLSTIHAISHDQPDEPVGAGHLTAVITALLDKDPKTRPGIDAVLHMLNGTQPPSRTKVLPRPEAGRRRIWLRPALSVLSVGAAGLLAFAVASQFREQGHPSGKSSNSAVSATRGDSPSPTSTPTAKPTPTPTPTPTEGRSPGPDAGACNAAVQTAGNALQLSGIALGDPNRSSADKAHDGSAALRDGAKQVSDLANHATESPVKAKLHAIAGDLNTQADALDAQLPKVVDGRLVSTKATDLAMKHLKEDVGDLKFLCWK
ncbi:serine/threonine protein kinase [Streptomyces sp. RPA4-5]|uniref:serine/threonine-protein kinase n=1 Tax=unclassified Streptomyces TaxID=2593676 RepID=UPI00143E155D|nr:MULTISPECIES: serine/threonine-protein kinase [unclassified Streptomyces]QIY53729.1 serine/threonine protein kinase [Streptomyces sp. RPA4-5]WJY36274.1 serine/threonine-protein kinase [Streptomyces sp. P9-2B-2]